MAQRLMFVTISACEEPIPSGDGCSDLRIDGHRIAFLQQPLLDRLQGRVKPSNNGVSQHWHLAFFAGTPYEERLLVSFVESEPKSGELKKVAARAIWQALPNGGPPSDEQVELASRWLRKSATLRLDHYEERANRWIAVDGGGLSMFSGSVQETTFERAVLLLALACAYRLQIQSLMNAMSSWDNSSRKLAEMVRRATEFNARFYFRHPVKMEHTELPLIWQQIAERLRLHEFDTELSEQLQELHQLCTGAEREREQRRWQWAGFGLGLLSALQVVNLVPDAVRDRWMKTVLAWIGVCS